MNMATKALLTSAILLSVSVNANAALDDMPAPVATPAVTPAPAAQVGWAADVQNVNNSCKADAATAGCGQEVVGKGLLNCLHNYKKAHRNYRFSDGCRDAMEHMREDRRAGK